MDTPSAQDGRCNNCGAYTTLNLGGTWICEGCYETSGSCCHEADDTNEVRGGTEPLDSAARSDPRRAVPVEMDQILADSFPASDPPSWTLGYVSDALLREAGMAVDQPRRLVQGPERLPAISHETA